MMALLKEKGVDSVGTRRGNRKGEPVVRSFFAKCFYKLINRISKIEMVPGARDYRLMTRRMVDSVLSLKKEYEKDIRIFGRADHAMCPLLYPEEYWGKVWEFAEKYI